MSFLKKNNKTRWILLSISFCIVALILWNTYDFFQIFKNEERFKVQLWAKAQSLINSTDDNVDLDLPLAIISNNQNIPVILVDERNKVINFNNIDESVLKDSVSTQRTLLRLKKENEPIVIEYIEGKYQYLYYGNSSLISKLKYYPLALLLIIFLFALLIFNYYKTTKIAAQNKLWAGMAKETAHQIGTPLSSLVGWLELLKTEQVSSSTILEIEKDITRLKTITDRFSKIGSEPKLSKVDIIAETFISFEYLKARFSNQILFDFIAPKNAYYVNLNTELHSWSIENLMKNAVDAMKGKGKLTLTITLEDKGINIFVSDTGKGIPKKEFKKIFEPGFTTKKRGWGLGLSLTKRIVEEYHKGSVKVFHSEVNKGTTFIITYKLAE